MIDPHISEAPPATTDRLLRQFAALWMLAFGGMAGWQGLVRDHYATAIILTALAVAVGLRGLARPAAIRPLYGSLMAVTYPVGWVVSQLVLALLFLGIFTPVALLFRLIRRDVLDRRRRPDRTSHWLPKRMPTDVRSYFRQS